jgi:hypothetical protein
MCTALAAVLGLRTELPQGDLSLAAPPAPPAQPRSLPSFIRRAHAPLTLLACPPMQYTGLPPHFVSGCRAGCD